MHFDYIILGGGAAGLSLAHRMACDSFFDDKSIALIEKGPKDTNDRTWCFWEVGDGYFEKIIKKKWSKLKFFSKTLDKTQDINPYEYKMISGLDFYNYTLSKIESSSNITYIKDSVKSIDEASDNVIIECFQNSYSANQVFKSYPSIDKIDPAKEVYVDQHFKGYFIETEVASFDPDCATFMDFRIDQNGDTRFLYVLPETDKKALVEVALFSNQLLEKEAYDKILDDYIKDFLHLGKFKIEEEEFGIIPMTSYGFKNHNTHRIFHIGTGGGIVKASSGFAFNRIQQHSDQLIDCIKNGKPLEKSYAGLHGRHLFYDKVMLHAMLYNGASGEEIFTKLFAKKSAQQIFKFLDQETSHIEDIGIFQAPPMWPFVKSFFASIFK